MAKKRKEKVEERKKARQESKARVDSIVNPPSFLDNVREMRDSDISVMSNTDKIDKVDSGIKPITPASKEVAGINAPDFSSPNGIDDRRYRERGTVEVITPVTPFKTTAAPKGVYSTESATPTPVGKAVAQNPTGIKNPAIEAAKEATKPKTLSDLLAEQRQAAIKEKTDAAKMQKYYALTDALNALGRMGGTAIGGAIGGGMLDSAPVVEAYQPSRGYLTAFEDAKRASERIKAIDDKGFQLAYSKQERDEERKARQQEAQAERNWQMTLLDYKNQIDRANAAQDFERSAKLQRELNEMKNRHEITLQNLRNKGALDEKRLGLETSKWQADVYNTTPIRFNDGSSVKIPDNYYEAIKRSLMAMGQVDGKTIDKDNVDSFIVNNPKLVNEYLSAWGLNASKDEAEQSSPAASTVKKTPYSGPSSRVDYADKEFKKALASGAYDVKPIAEKKEASSSEADLDKKWGSLEIK